MAERTIDAQYYLLHNDPTGHLFTWALLQAADRGVRVRLLIDDIDVSQYDAAVAALDQHPNLDIRVFNPFRRGFGKNIASLFEFRRVNRRMHNKSMTFDSVVTVVGGRNIGDEYFAARDEYNYYDLDVLGMGPIARDVSTNFDAYWNSDWAVPVGAIASRRKELTLAQARQRLGELVEDSRQSAYGDALAHRVRQEVNRSAIDIDWVPATLISDTPDKASGEADPSTFVAAKVLPYIEGARDSLFVSSAYFVPRKRGVALLTGLARRGIKVTILTNSADSTDVVPVYAHYAKHRKKMLEAGIRLWEFKQDADRPDRERLGLGLSQSSLHTKAFAVDRRYLFVGSFNWDPRSVNINGEMGVMIESPALAAQAVRAFQENIDRNAYRLRLNEEGEIEWLERKPDRIVLHRREPIKSGWRAFMSGVYRLLPIGGQL